MPSSNTKIWRPWAILLLGLIVALVAYSAYYSARTAPHRSMLKENAPELTWLKHEFKLSDTDFERVSDLHEAYLPQCAEMCRKIAAKNTELRDLLKSANDVTPEVEAKMKEANALRVECQKNMLQHFFQVSRAMPAAQGKRYLEWVQKTTVVGETGMMIDQHGHHE